MSGGAVAESAVLAAIGRLAGGRHIGQRSRSLRVCLVVAPRGAGESGWLHADGWTAGPGNGVTAMSPAALTCGGVAGRGRDS